MASVQCLLAGRQDICCRTNEGKESGYEKDEVAGFHALFETVVAQQSA